MNGYRYMIERNRLMYALEDALKKLADLPAAERDVEARRLRAKFDFELAGLYAQMADEYPGERRKKARPLEDPR